MSNGKEPRIQISSAWSCKVAIGDRRTTGSTRGFLFIFPLFNKHNIFKIRLLVSTLFKFICCSSLNNSFTVFIPSSVKNPSASFVMVIFMVFVLLLKYSFLIFQDILNPILQSINIDLSAMFYKFYIIFG